MLTSGRTLSVIIIATGIALLAACGGNGKPVPMDEMPDRMAETYCKQMFECCSSSERNAQTGDGLSIDTSSEQQCRDTYGGLVQTFLLAPLRTSVDEGRAEYDGEKMGNCLADLDSDDCSNFPPDGRSPTTCDEAIIPKVELGGTCARDYECKQGKCDKDNSDADTGTCKQLPGGGEDCEGFRCREGYYCGGDSCQPAKAQGETCISGSMCESSVCDGGTCAPKKSGGESCERDGVCKSGLCNENEDGDGGTCLSAPACDGE